MIKIGIVGGTGYTGVELLRLLAAHPDADVRAITSRKDAGTAVADMFPSLRGRYDLAFCDPADARLDACDVVFFATPHGVAMAQARELARRRRARHRPRRRLPPQGPGGVRALVRHAARLPRPPRRSRLRAAGVEPRGDPQGARIVGNPGLLPDDDAARLRCRCSRPASIDAGHLIADCKSGVSGAGRKAELGLLFAEASDNFKAYSVRRPSPPPGDRRAASAASPRDAGRPGVHAAPGADGPRHPLDALRPLTTRRRRPAGAVRAALRRRALRRRAAARIDARHPLGARVERAAASPCIARRAATWSRCLVVQDNLVKGAAGQAVQNMNLMFGLPETAGLAGARPPSLSERLTPGRTCVAPCAPALLDRCAADVGALAPALAVARRARRRAPGRGRRACGGGDSTSARSSAASTARRSRPGWRRSRKRSAGCAWSPPNCAPAPRSSTASWR